jgi:hypothetical protein
VGLKFLYVSLDIPVSLQQKNLFPHEAKCPIFASVAKCRVVKCSDTLLKMEKRKKKESAKKERKNSTTIDFIIKIY